MFKESTFSLLDGHFLIYTVVLFNVILAMGNDVTHERYLYPVSCTLNLGNLLFISNILALINFIIKQS